MCTVRTYNIILPRSSGGGLTIVPGPGRVVAIDFATQIKLQAGHTCGCLIAHAIKTYTSEAVLDWQSGTSKTRAWHLQHESIIVLTLLGFL
jgi:hypothetical protein